VREADDVELRDADEDTIEMSNTKFPRIVWGYKPAELLTPDTEDEARTLLLEREAEDD
jgi:hypothetical protein